MDATTSANILQRIEQLNSIGIALSAEKSTRRLLEMILLGAKSITNADGGTLYTVTEDQRLKFEMVRTDSLNFVMGGTTGVNIPFDPIPLYDHEGRPNTNMVVVYSVLNDTTINISDAYIAKGFDFSGTRAFDRNTGYRSKSFLTIPMKNHENDIIGVLQLINKQDPLTQEVLPFANEDQRLAESLASQAAVALTNHQLIKKLELLFESFIQLVAAAIDEKSPYTAAHCKRVPVLTLFLAEAAGRVQEGPLKDFILTEEDRYELEIAAWLHDCGKITTPEYVVDKATKLETIFDRIHLLDTRFEVLKRDAEISMLRAIIAAVRNGKEAQIAALEQACQERVKQLDEDREFLRTCNMGNESMPPSHQQRVKKIANYTWINSKGEEAPFLGENEVYNLTIPKGTLTREERNMINHHVVVTAKMLESLTFPKHLKNVAEYAGGHHERIDGQGYPRGLTGEQMSIQARIIAIADIFEALTAKDRPYKKSKTLSQALYLMGKMKQENHIDPDLFDVFINEKVYLHYAKEYLDPEQIDQIELASIPGYTPANGVRLVDS
jgi:HD-GYP domain-containing protein (c-di-GMP phosphodiesterase class II)